MAFSQPQAIHSLGTLRSTCLELINSGVVFVKESVFAKKGENNCVFDGSIFSYDNGLVESLVFIYL